MHEIPVQVLNGLVVGSSLALVSSGLALLFGVLDIINFAQGDYYMLGGYALWITQRQTGNFWLSILVAAIVVGVGGGLLLMAIVWPLRDKSHALVLLATLGLSLILQQLATNIFGGDTKLIHPPIALQIPIAGIRYPVYDLLIIIVGLLVLTGGFFFLKYAKYGIWLRAVAQNRSMAAALGVPVPRVYALAFIAASALAGVAGSMLVPVTSVYPTVGNDVILLAFIIVVAGGLGNFRGAAIMALLLGEVQALGSIVVRPVEVEIVLFILVIALMVLRSRRESVLLRL